MTIIKSAVISNATMASKKSKQASAADILSTDNTGE